MDALQGRGAEKEDELQGDEEEGRGSEGTLQRTPGPSQRTYGATSVSRQPPRTLLAKKASPKEGEDEAMELLIPDLHKESDGQPPEEMTRCQWLRTSLWLAPIGFATQLMDLITFKVLLYLPPSAYAVMGQAVIIWTLLMRTFILKKPTSATQYVAVLAIFLGAIQFRADELEALIFSRKPWNPEDQSTHVLYGFSLALLRGLVASGMGVYQEFAFDKFNMVFSYQEIEMFQNFYAMVSALAWIILFHRSVFTNGFFFGWNLAALTLVIYFGVFVGLIVLTIKLTNSMRKTQVVMLGSSLTMFLDWYIFGEPIELSQIISAIIVVCGVLIYNMNKKS